MGWVGGKRQHSKTAFWKAAMHYTTNTKKAFWIAARLFFGFVFLHCQPEQLRSYWRIW